MSGLPGPFSFLRPLGATGGAAIGFAVGHGVSPAIRPVIQDLANTAWELHQVRPLEPSIAAQLVAEGLWSADQGTAEAARSGVNPDRFAGLIEEARSGPTIEQAFAGVRRGLLGGAELTRAMRQAGVRPEWDELMRALVEVLPSVTDMVRFGVREVYDPAARSALDLDAEFPPAFAADAARVGLSRETAGNYWAAHWDLPSYEQGVAMLHRGLISQAQFDGLLKALDYAPTWRDKLRGIALRVPPIADMIRFAVREVYDPAARAALDLDADYPDAFTGQAALHGMSEEHARDYWASHWRLPSARQGYVMLWRGLITEPQLDQLLKALDYPRVWRDRLAAIARIVPGRIDLKRMLRHGIKTEQEVEAGYRRLGYDADDAAAMTAIAVAEVEAGTTGDTYVSKARTSLFNRVHTEFVSRQLTRTEAEAGLAAAGVPGPQRGPVLTVWERESELIRTELTQAQIVKAHKKGLLTEAEALAELQERGMSASDAAIRLQSG